MEHGGKRKGAGRKRMYDEVQKPHSYCCTDAQNELIRDFIAKVKSSSKNIKEK